MLVFRSVYREKKVVSSFPGLLKAFSPVWSSQTVMFLYSWEQARLKYLPIAQLVTSVSPGVHLDKSRKKLLTPIKRNFSLWLVWPVCQTSSTCLTDGISSWQVVVYIAGLRNAGDNPFALLLWSKALFLYPVPDLESYPLQN